MLSIPRPLVVPPQFLRIEAGRPEKFLPCRPPGTIEPVPRNFWIVIKASKPDWRALVASRKKSMT